MRIDFVICPASIEDKLISKHHVTALEALLLNSPRIRFAEQGYVEGEDVYASFGRTFDGRYSSVFFVYKPTSRTAII